MMYILNTQKIRLLVSSLIFSFWLAGCSDTEGKGTLSLIQENGKTTGIAIPRSLLPGLPENKVEQVIQVRLSSNADQPAILGDYILQRDSVFFRPLIPFTSGLQYVLFYKNKTLANFQSYANGEGPVVAAVVTNIYPQPDTLPENLLKMYIRFSRPMQEGESLKHIILTVNGQDTLSNAFLDLNHELWDTTHTMLTLWFDPGRIKRDLQPNIAMGPPLKQGARYTLTIKEDWRDATGGTLAVPYTKSFVTGKRDSLSPDVAKWTIEAPTAGTTNPLTIYLYESLDYVLLNNTIHIVDAKKQPVAGTLTVNDEGTELIFIPAGNWSAGNYAVEIDADLEDVAGNTLTHLFDNDLTIKRKQPAKDIFTRTFIVK